MWGGREGWGEVVGQRGSEVSLTPEQVKGTCGSHTRHQYSKGSRMAYPYSHTA